MSCCRLLDSIGGASIVSQAHDPWSQLVPQAIAIFIGALVAGIINYKLQKRSFYQDTELKMFDRRIAAYVNLLHDIVDYQQTSEIGNDMFFHMYEALIFGSDQASKRIGPLMDANLKVDNDFFGQSLKDIEKQ
jgi:hypothetical protein